MIHRISSHLLTIFTKSFFFKKKVPPRRRFGVFIADLKHISFLYQLFLWLL